MGNQDNVTKYLYMKSRYSEIENGRIIRTGITCKKIPLLKSIEFGMALK